jgi:hypothetical protein
LHANKKVQIPYAHFQNFLLLLLNTTRARMVPGPPSTGVAIAMDGFGMGEWRAHFVGRSVNFCARALAFGKIFSTLLKTPNQVAF